MYCLFSRELIKVVLVKIGLLAKKFLSGYFTLEGLFLLSNHIISHNFWAEHVPPESVLIVLMKIVW
jgi:hypothetical protein